VAAALCVTAPAAALSSEPSVNTRLALRSGGAPAPGNPEITDVICRRDCIGLRSPVVGGLIEVTGMGLADSVSVSFPGADGRVLAPVTRADEARAFARVPQGATDGRVRVRGTYGSRSDLSEASFDIRPRSELGSAGVLTLLEGSVTPKKTYLFGTKPPILRYVIASDQRRNDLRVDVVDTSGAVVRSFFRNDVPANSTQSIRWDARAQDKSPVRDGRYSFRIAGQTSGTAQRSREMREARNVTNLGKEKLMSSWATACAPAWRMPRAMACAVVWLEMPTNSVSPAASIPIAERRITVSPSRVEPHLCAEPSVKSGFMLPCSTIQRGV